MDPPARRPDAPGRPPQGSGIAVGAALAIVVLLLAGIVPGFRLTPSPAGPSVETERTAAGAAEAIAAAAPGGPWTFFGAVGVGSWSGGPLGENGTSRLVGAFSACAAGGPLPPWPPLVPTPGPTYAEGLLSAWAFGYFSTAGPGAILVVLVAGGTARPFAEFGGATCPQPTPPIVAFGGSADSPAAARAVVATPLGAAFVAGHPRANVTLSLLPGYSTGTGWAPLWLVTVSACGPSAGTDPGVLEAFVNGTSAAVRSIAALGCPGPAA